MSNSVPEGWYQSKLGVVADLIMGQSPPSNTYNNSRIGLPFFQGKTDFGSHYPSVRVWCSKPTKVAEKDSILFSVRAPVGDINIASESCCIGRGLAAIKGTKVEQAFLYQTFKFVKHRFQLLAQGSTFEAVSGGEMRDFKLILPPLPEQKKIAAILTSVDTVIEKTQAQIDKLKDLKTGMMQELLTKGIGHTEFKDSPVGRIPVEWDVVSFQDIATCKPKKFNPSNDDFIYNCVELEHLSQETGQIINTTPTNNVVSIKNIFNVGDILFGKLRPYLKKYALPDFSGVCSSEIWVFKPKDGIDNYFLYYNVQSERFIESANKSCGTKMPRAELSTVMDTVIVKPPTEEQIKIGKIIKTIDDSLMTKQDKLSSLLNIKKALMQDLLTGKVRVKV